MKLLLAKDFEIRPLVAENNRLANFEVVKPENDEHLALQSTGNFVMVGDKLDSFTVLKAMAEKTGVIIFDASINALPTALSSESFLKHLIEFIPPERIMLVGVRDLTLEEVAFVKENKINYYTMQSITMNSFQSVCDAVMESAKDWPGCYVSISLNVLDPAFANVPKPSPGGLSTRQMLYFVQRLRMLRNFLAGDVVDCADALPVAEKLLTELSVIK